MPKQIGYKEIIAACGGDSKAASTLLLLEQLDTLVGRQTDALANLKIDKITVWDSGSGGNGDGQNATSSFIRNFISALPPIHDLAKQVGIDLPDYLGSMNVEGGIKLEDAKEMKAEVAEEVKVQKPARTAPVGKRATPRKK